MKKINLKLWFGIIMFLAVVILLPVLVQHLMTTNYAKTLGGSNDGWLGFWGGYLGSVIGISGTVVFTIFYSKEQIEGNRKSQVQAYIHQEQIKALNKYLSSMLSLDLELREVKRALNNDGIIGKFFDNVSDQIDGLRDLNNEYVLLTGSERAEMIATVQNSIQRKSSSIIKQAGIFEAGGTYDRVAFSEDLENLYKELNQGVTKTRDVLNSYYE